jgi:DNA-binding LytR/AlgR family response regulator
MSQMNFLIVDDETFARKQIGELVKKVCPECVIIEASTLSEAKSAISQTDFSIIFLDINLKGELGFDLVPSISKQTKIVFITAMDKYAIRAFEVNAMDYILKPPTFDRIKKAIDIYTHDPREKINLKIFSIDDRIFVQSNDVVQYIYIKDIRYVSAEGVYTHLFTSDSKPFLVRKSLTEWSDLLPKKHFIRIHRSTLINLNAIDHMKPLGKGMFNVYIKGFNDPLTISRSYSSEIKKLFMV